MKVSYLVDKDYKEKNIDDSLINPASFNVTLKTIRRMTDSWRHFIAYPNFAQQMAYWKSLGSPDVKDKSKRDLFFAKETPLTNEVNHIILPGEYALFSTHELMSFPNGHAALVLIRSGDARGGADHFNTFIDAGFGYPDPVPLVLEVINHAPWPKIIKGSQQLAQIFTLTGPMSERPYDGSYKNQSGAEPPI